MNRPLFAILTALSIFGVIYGGLASGASPAKTTDAASGKTAIRNVRLFDGRAVVSNATVVFEHGVITAAGAGVAVPDGATIVDGSGKTLMPGLIDSHAHAFPPALERALRFGVTTELDMFTSVDGLKQWKEEQARGNVATRADIFSAGTLITVAGGHGTEYFKIPTFTPGGDAQAFVDARIAEGSDFIKLVYEDGSAFGVHYLSLTKDDLRSLIAAAHKRGKIAVVHIGSLEGARTAIDAGADGLAHLFGNGRPDPEFGRFVAAHHAFVVPTLTVVESSGGTQSGASLVSDERTKSFLSAYEIRGLRSSFRKRAESTMKVTNAFEAVQQLKAAGVPLLAGTDAPNPGTAHGVSMHRELELLVQAGLTPVEALTAATATPAAIFHLKDRGRIAPGLRADLLLVDGDPTKDILATRAIAAIWKGGVALERKPETSRSDIASEAVQGAKLAAGMISNFDSGEITSDFGSGWAVSTDEMMGGNSKATMEIAAGGANNTPKALLVHSEIKSGYTFPWAGAMFFAGSQKMRPVDLSAKKGLRFYAKGNTDVRVLIFAESLGQIPATVVVHAGSDWTEIKVSWSDAGIDGKDFQAVLFSGAQSEGKSEFRIDEVRVE
ncbi:MAG TPA: amidohydrolase family protein [Thermoanaerobaculia bacterium]|nr:amidohydrolase family protein [Thermoanaerobaculia bacterium]